jgi:hypothetical protein
VILALRTHYTRRSGGQKNFARGAVDARDTGLTKIVSRHRRLPFAERIGMADGLVTPAGNLMAGFSFNKPCLARMIAIIATVQALAFGVDSASNVMLSR